MLSAAERATLAAVLERLIPGAAEAQVIRYVERALEEHRDVYAEGLAALDGFASLEPAQLDVRLAAIEGSAFFELVRLHAIQGMFADPLPRRQRRLRRLGPARLPGREGDVHGGRPGARRRRPAGPVKPSARRRRRGRARRRRRHRCAPVRRGGPEGRRPRGGPARRPARLRLRRARERLRKPARREGERRGADLAADGRRRGDDEPRRAPRQADGERRRRRDDPLRRPALPARAVALPAPQLGGRTAPCRRTAPRPTGRSATTSSSPTTTPSTASSAFPAPAASNPFEGPRSRDYPLPPLRRTGWTELVADAARRRGLHPFPGPAAILSEPYRGQPACTYCGFCNWNGCHVDAKGSTFLNAIPRAEATGNLEVVPGARVTGIDGRPRRSRGRRRATCATGARCVQPARFVVLSAHSFENVRLLLLSRSPRPPGRPREQPRSGRAATR